MTDFTQELKRLQKLSCITLSPEEEKRFWAQINNIIGFLGQLPETKLTTNNEQITVKDKLTLRTITGLKESAENKELLKNVKHPIVNNSIVIKSVLN